MNRSGPELLANSLIVGHDVAKAAATGADVDVTASPANTAQVAQQFLGIGCLALVLLNAC